MSLPPVYITTAKRTVQGDFRGKLSSLSAIDMAAVVIRSLWESNSNSTIDHVILGNVLSAGLGQAPARQALFKANLKTMDVTTIPAYTINKVCGSGMQAVINGMMLLQTTASVKNVIVGGMESMTNAPHLLPKARLGYGYGSATLVDHLHFDGLEDGCSDTKLSMGQLADRMAMHPAENTSGITDLLHPLTRQELDEYATRSLSKALDAWRGGAFEAEAIALATSREVVTTDVHPYKVKVDRIPTLSPSFHAEGLLTAASSSAISDGAAGLWLTSSPQDGLPPLARLVAWAGHASSPQDFTLAPIQAIEKACHQAGWTVEQVDLFEINEAFASVPLLAANAFKIPLEKVNIHGGACALGHPIGASGSRILVTLCHALQRYQLRRGVATICIGGGEALAVAVER